ncbi:DUF4258 domain-containing protein [Thermodesulfobacteriota bacterium]
MNCTQHFKDMMKERLIQPTWVDMTLNEPEKVDDKPDGTRHYLRRIPEHGNRWLRIVVNVEAKPNKAVTVFFDRGMKGKQ